MAKTRWLRAALAPRDPLAGNGSFGADTKGFDLGLDDLGDDFVDFDNDLDDTDEFVRSVSQRGFVGGQMVGVDATE